MRQLCDFHLSFAIVVMISMYAGSEHTTNTVTKLKAGVNVNLNEEV